MNNTIKAIVDNAIADYNARVDRFFDSFDNFAQFDKFCTMVEKMLWNKISPMYSDLYACARMGFITEEEVDCIKELTNRKINKAVREAYARMKAKLGEEEYSIQYSMVRFGMSREKAEKFYLDEEV